jgi:hypothetical protein
MNIKQGTAALLILLGIPLTVTACLWDSDTPAEEAKGLPEVVAVLTGRFDRFPPLYYEMRLTRVAAHLMKHPEDLGAYDDAGVACDRLGKGDEAVAWMEKKKTQLDLLDASVPEEKEQRYRYHANLGTFLVHRWSRQGSDRSKIDEVKAGRTEIARALEINPDAHFGREKFQLMAMDWIIDPPKAAGETYLPNLLGWIPHPLLSDQDPDQADATVRGLAGLIMLGNAWQSVDVFNALNVALQHDTLGFTRETKGGRNTLAYLAWLRCRELIDAGQRSMLPDALKGEALKSILPRPDMLEADRLLDPTFAFLRAEADAWHSARTAFMVKRLEEGRHPDTEPNFWVGYTAKPPPDLPKISVPTSFYEAQATREWWIKSLILIYIPLLAVAWVAVCRARVMRQKAFRQRLVANLVAGSVGSQQPEGERDP